MYWFVLDLLIIARPNWHVEMKTSW
eukprot:SAG11_NODE_18308_length_494_cov_4.531646_1_plen_24_part_10